MVKKHTVAKEYAGTRLDVFLHSRYSDFSRSWIQKLIKKGKASVNNKNSPASKRLAASDAVRFEFEPPPEISLEPDKSLSDKIRVVFENDDFLIIDKPSGISVHPSSSEPAGTVVNWLLHHYPPIKSVGDPAPFGNPKGAGLRPGIVHRLDKDTSGVMVIAKNQKTFLWLKKQFQSRLVIKKYIALVNGSPKSENGKIELNIIRSKTDPTKNIALKSKTTGRPALTYWLVIRRYVDHTLMEVTPKTGRKHQIRVHLKAAGFPVCGDKKYGSPRLDPKHLGRMFLHAQYLSFNSPGGEKFSFNAPLPEELEQALQNLPFMIK
ncbi:MAG: RluA family pseudouridine synthase [Parcubacteria group bacterium]|nr:RluA family pseudouridine synthase [Parcubacteria group bacterium]